MEFHIPHHLPKVDISETTLSENWSNIFNGHVGKDDPLWAEYLKKANSFDLHIVDDWNKIVDVILVYVGVLFAIFTMLVAYHRIEHRLRYSLPS